MAYKYLTVVNEDTVATENFINGDLSSATPYKDYISTDAADGNMNYPDLYEKTDPSLLSSGRIVKKDKIHFEPETNFTTGLGGLCFLCQSLGDSIFEGADETPTSISEMVSGDKLYISLNNEENKSFTVYAGQKAIYSNAVVYALGTQINELTLPLEEGDVAVEVTNYASRQILDETNLSRGSSKYLGENIRYGHLKNISLANYTESDGILTVPSLIGSWNSVGCDVQSGEVGFNFDLDEDTGYGFCNNGWSNGFKCGSPEITANVEITQDTDIWMKLVNGNNLEFEDLAKKSVKYSLEDSDYKLDIIYPNAVIALDDGANFNIDNPNEKVKFENETADIIYEGQNFNSCEGLLVLTKK